MSVLYQPASQPATNPPGIVLNTTSNVNQRIPIRFKMEDHLNFVDGRQPQSISFCKWKKT
jgi:hypothetical protein